MVGSPYPHTACGWNHYVGSSMQLRIGHQVAKITVAAKFVAPNSTMSTFHCTVLSFSFLSFFLFGERGGGRRRGGGVAQIGKSHVVQRRRIGRRKEGKKRGLDVCTVRCKVGTVKPGHV